MNVDDEKIEGFDHPYEKAFFFQRWTFWWLKDLLKLGLRKPLTPHDVYKNLDANDAARLTEKFQTEWKNEKNRKTQNPKIVNIIWKVFVSKIIGFSFLYSIVDTCLKVSQSQCLGGLVTYFAHTNSGTKTSALYNGIGLVSCALLSSCLTNPFRMYMLQMGLQIRVALASMIYNKAINMRTSSTIGSSTGKLINMLSFDTYRFDTVMSLLHHLWKGPMEIPVFGYILYREIGYYGWIGIAFIICFVPIQIIMGNMTANYRLGVVQQTDSRIRILNGIIQGIQTIKMYALEQPFMKIIGKIRIKELRAIRSIFVIRGILYSFSIISRVSIFLTLVSYVCFGHVFNPRQVFVVTSCFNFLYDSMLYYWTMAVTSFAECFVSMKRIEDFLLSPEAKISNDNKINYAFTPDILDKTVIKPSIQKIVRFNEDAPIPGIIMKNVSASWNNESQSGISDIHLEIHENQLIAITGPVASGKSSLFHVLLRELDIDCGELTVNGVISYSSQEPWLFDATVRQNICFTEDFESERYRQVVRMCNLERDIQSLPAGDLTFVGESGICLSGGQKSRINLARAIYRKADIYLLDDPLAAVDSAVSKTIFKTCIEEFLNDKICLLITHQKQCIKAANRVIDFSDGQIQQDEQRNRVDKVNRFISVAKDGPRKSIHGTRKHSQLYRSFIEQLENRKEFQSMGAVDKSIYKAYFKSAESPILLSAVVILFIIGQIAISAIDLIVSKWVNWEVKLSAQTNNTSMHNLSHLSMNHTNVEEIFISDRNKFVYIYAALIVVVLYLVFQRALTLYLFCLRASRRIHEKLLESILRAKMYFFSANSSGRIINRFSKDLYDIDFYLATTFYDLILCCLQAVMSLVLVSLANVWVLIATIVMSVLFYGLRQVYVCTARCLRRIEALGRSTIISHVNATVSGLSTIHATDSRDDLIGEFNALQNANTSASYIFKATTQAIAFWMELVCVIYMAITITIFLAFENQVSGGHVGLAITQILSLISLAQWGIRLTAELENNMTSVERVIEYIDLEPEEPPADEMIEVPEKWPNKGEIEFNDVSLKYSEKGDYILNSLSLKINPGEKVAVCGRTGAGKSSIVKALFQMAPHVGTIKIDSVDASKIPVNVLRKNISIIPQDAILFSGTMRQNLDPFDENSDDELWTVLEKVRLKDTVSDLPNGLDSQVLESDQNFSAGQRALVCLARAILRKNTILIQDEATAYLDIETDNLLQQTIQKEFVHCTVLTIAHRLNTIMDCDRVLVMDAGRIVEFDNAHHLLQQEDGFLNKLVNETGPTNAQILRDIAQNSCEQRHRKPNHSNESLVA